MTDLDYRGVSAVSACGGGVSSASFKEGGREGVRRDPLAESLRMNQQCKVCGEPAAGFHFGAFTCEGCKSFFGRSYNNLSSISECKNNGCCVINKKNRTSCKACRLRKCLMVGMSKSGSRYGRRSNWFKIHCLLQEQQQQQQHQQQQHTPPPQQPKSQSWDTHPALSLMNHPDPRIHQFLAQQQQQQQQQQQTIGRTTKEDLLLMGLDEYKHSTSPSISSPESHNSDSSVEVPDARIRAATFLRSPDSKDMFLPFASLSGFPPPFSFPPLFPPSYLYKPTPMLKTVHNINNNNNIVEPVDVFSKRFFLDAVLQSQRSPARPKLGGEEEEEEEDEGEDVDAADECVQENPMDLSMKACLIRERISPCGGGESEEGEDITDSEELTIEDGEDEKDTMKELRSVPMDLTAKV